MTTRHSSFRPDPLPPANASETACDDIQDNHAREDCLELTNQASRHGLSIAVAIGRL
jgi:hypothetical protein